jgi:Flp pilus assembly protein TadD
LYNYGTYLADAGQAEKAVPFLSKAVTLDPQYADAWHNLGRAYLLLGRTAEAVPALRTAVSLNPKLDNALLNYTIALIRTGEYRQAISVLEGQRQHASGVPGFHMNLGLAYTGIGDLSAARRELAELQRLDPNLARTLAEVIGRSAAPPSRR